MARNLDLCGLSIAQDRLRNAMAALRASMLRPPHGCSMRTLREQTAVVGALREMYFVIMDDFDFAACGGDGVEVEAQVMDRFAAAGHSTMLGSIAYRHILRSLTNAYIPADEIVTTVEAVRERTREWSDMDALYREPVITCDLTVERNWTEPAQD